MRGIWVLSLGEIFAEERGKWVSSPGESTLCMEDGYSQDEHYYCILNYNCVITRLKCQLSGDALQGSGSQLNVIKYHCLSLLIQIPYPLQLVPVTRI